MNDSISRRLTPNKASHSSPQSSRPGAYLAPTSCTPSGIPLEGHPLGTVSAGHNVDDRPCAAGPKIRKSLVADRYHTGQVNGHNAVPVRPIHALKRDQQSIRTFRVLGISRRPHGLGIEIERQQHREPPGCNCHRLKPRSVPVIVSGFRVYCMAGG